MNALSPRPPFQVLIMSEESRLGREQIHTAAALMQIMDAGVRVFFYLDDRERTLDSAMDKVMFSLTNFSSEMEREKAGQRTYDAMLRKAKALHVTGGRVYGCDNVDILAPDPGPDGRPRRLCVRRQINDAQAAIVRRIFQLCADGFGLTRIAKTLNAEGIAPPRPHGRGCRRPSVKFSTATSTAASSSGTAARRSSAEAPRPSESAPPPNGCGSRPRSCKLSRPNSGKPRTSVWRGRGIRSSRELGSRVPVWISPRPIS
jgi:DNA invertase Pin-like site-specific DNA recombinase